MRKEGERGVRGYVVIFLFVSSLIVSSVLAMVTWLWENSSSAYITELVSNS